MQAGKMRDRILIYTIGSSVDSFGEVTNTPDTIANVSAYVKAESGSETQDNEQIKGLTQYSIIIRYLEGINATHKITWGTKTLEILSICADPKKTQLKISAIETQ